MKLTSRSIFRRPLLGLLAGVAIIFLAWPSWSAKADNVVQTFSSSTTLKAGQVVSLGDKASTVEVTPGDNSSIMYGVVIDSTQAPLTLVGQGQPVYVASNGDYQVMLDTENGPIKTGDYISMSSTAGVGAKASIDQSTVLGRAEANFDGSKNVIGHDGRYAVGKVLMGIAVSRNPQFKNTLTVPSPLQKIGNSIAGREVSPFKIYVAVIIFVTATALAIILLVVGIRSAMVAIGRNPLSRHTILRGLFQIISTSLIIFIGSLVGVYLILKL